MAKLESRHASGFARVRYGMSSFTRFRPAFTRETRVAFGAAALTGLALVAVVTPSLVGQDVTLKGNGARYLAANPAPPPEMLDSRAELAASAAAPVAKSEAPSHASGGSSAPHPHARALQKHGTLQLLVPDIDGALVKLRASLALFGGDVLQIADSRPSAPGDPRVANATVEVPASAFDRAMSTFAQFGGVRTRNVDVKDVGDQLVDDGARLRNLRRTERDLLRIMDRSGKVSDVLDVENQLASTRDEIERLDAERAALQGRVDYATIDLTYSSEIVAPAPAEASARSLIANSWTAARRAVGAFTLALIARILVAIAFAPYWIAAGIIFALLFALARNLLRRLSSRARTGLVT